MRTLQVISQDSNPAMQGVQGMIGLSNRPHLKIGMGRLDEICSVLAKSKGDRTKFVADPTSYLQGQALPVSSCNFTRTVVNNGGPQTSEVCTMNTICNVNAGVNVNALVNINAAMNIYLVYRYKVIAYLEGDPGGDELITMNTLTPWNMPSSGGLL